MRQRETTWGVAVLGGLLAIFLWDVLLLGRTVVLRDAHALFVPLRQFLRERVLAGELPLWNPYAFAGHPFLAHLQSAACHPLTYLLLPLPTRAWLHAHLALHLLLLGGSTLALCRALGTGAHAAVLGGAVAMLGGLPIVYLEFLPQLAALAWTPLVFVLFRRTVREAGGRAPVWLGIVLALQLLAGNPYPTFYAAVGLALYTPFLLVAARPPPGRVLGRGALALAIFAGLAAVQVLPLVALMREQAPPGGYRAVLGPAFSLHPVEWLSALVPRLFGYPDWQKCFYVGLLPLALIALGLVHVTRAPAAARRTAVAPAEAGAFAVLMVAGLVLALGQHVGVSAALAETVPLASRLMKWPTTAMILFMLGAAVLTAVGADVLLRGGVGRRALAVLSVVAALAVAVAVGDRLTGAGLLEGVRAAYRVELLAVRSADAAPAAFPLAPEVRRAAVLAAAAVAALWLIAVRRPSIGVGFVVLLAVLAVDLLPFARSLVYFAFDDLYAAETRTIAQLREPLAREPARVLLVRPDGLNDLAYGSRSEGDFTFLRNVLVGSVGLPYGLFDADGVGPLPPTRWVAFLRRAERLPPDARNRVLGLLNVRVLLETGRTAAGALAYRVTENPAVRARAVLVARWIRVPDTDAAAALLTRDPAAVAARAVIVANEAVPPPLPDPGGAPGAIERVTYTANTVRVDLRADRDALLVLADRHASGWEAAVDGAARTIYEADAMLRAVHVPAGSRVVTFRYRAPGLGAGLAITLATLLATAVLLVRAGAVAGRAGSGARPARVGARQA